MTQEIEIPFGAYDSILKGWEYTIPKGFTAEIKDGKVVVKEKESEDEMIRKWLIKYFNKSDFNGLLEYVNGIKAEDILAWLEKQKEQKPVDLVAELKLHLANTPKEQLEKEWKELEPWSKIGPTVQEFLYGKQSEVDLEEAITEYYGNIPEDKDKVDAARHFYELGLNTKNSQK